MNEEPVPEERAGDLYCSRCGQSMPDPDETKAGRSVNKSYHAMALQLAEHARRRFESVGEIRRMRGLSHPRVQRLYGNQLEPGWLLSEEREGVFGRGHQWSAIVIIEEGGMRTMTLDPNDGSGLASRGLEPHKYYFVDTFSVEPTRLEKV